MSYIELACRGVLAAVFLISVVSKVRGRRHYASFVAATGRLVPAAIRVPASTLAVVVVTLEAGVVVLLVIPGRAGWGFALAGLLVVGFGSAIGAALRRGERGACNCFGASATPLGAGQLVRNAVLAAVAAGGLLAGAAATVPVGALDPAGAATALVAAAVLAGLVVATDDILALFRTGGRTGQPATPVRPPNRPPYLS